MFRSIVLLCVVAALVHGQSTEVSRCTVFQGELPANIYIEGCVTPPCQLPQLQDAVINMVFKIPYLIRKMRTVATAWVIPIVPIPYDLQENAETCNFLNNSYCPVLQGEIVQYTLRMYIQPFFPVNTQATIEFRVVDDDNKPFICIRVPIAIRSPVNPSIAKNATLPQTFNLNISRNSTINLV